MKKVIAILMILLMLTSCSKKVDNETAVPDIKEKETTVEIEQSSDNQKNDETTQDNESTDEAVVDDIATDEDVINDNSIISDTDEEEGVVVSGAGYAQSGTQTVGGGYKSTEMDKYDVKYIMSANSVHFDSVEKLYNFADLVVVATPIQKYEDGEQVWCDVTNATVSTFEAAQLSHSFTKRKYKVNKVIKGENIEEFDLYVRAITDGKTLQIMEGEYIAEQGNEYLLFLYKSPVTENLYLPVISQGKLDTNSQNSESNYQIDQNIFKQAKEKFKDEIK